VSSWIINVILKDFIPYRRHLVKAKQGVAGEVTDLRNDIRQIFGTLSLSGSLLKNNFTATTNPTVNDDETQDYSVGSRWINNTFPRREFVCVSNVTGTAIWKETTLSPSGILTQDNVLSKDQSSPPVGIPSLNDRYIVNPPGAGLWTGRDNDIAQWNGAAWIFHTPVEGWTVWVEDIDEHYTFDGTQWKIFESFLDHSQLYNLTVADPHTQYQLRSEKGAALGYASLDAAGEIVDATHGSRSGGTLHALVTPNPGGLAGFMSPADKQKLDGIATGATNTPLSNNAPQDVTKAASSAGVGVAASRDDHKHDIATGIPSSVGAANAEGASSSLARADHIHDHGALTGGNRHALVVPSGAAGFMSGSDKQKLDGIAPGATNTPLSSGTPVNVDKSAAAPGTDSAASRRDHKHDVTTGVPSDVGSANAEGVGSALARADHVHNHANQGGGALHSLAVPSGAAGFMSGADKQKLDNSGILTSSAPVNVTKAAAAVGVSGEAARQDHKHDITTAIAGSIQIGDAAAEGSASSLSRSDHVHAVAAPGAPANVTKAAAVAGVSSSPARADHKHDVNTGVPVAVGGVNQEGTSTALARADHVHAASPGTIASAVLVWGDTNIGATTTTRYLTPGYANSVAKTTALQLRMPRSGTLQNFYLRHTSGGGNGNNIVYTFRKNGVATGLTVTLASTANDASDLVNTVTVAKGDLIDIEITKAAGIAGSPTDVIATVEYA
jgi:hypothetical protein